MAERTVSDITSGTSYYLENYDRLKKLSDSQLAQTGYSRSDLELMRTVSLRPQYTIENSSTYTNLQSYTDEAVYYLDELPDDFISRFTECIKNDIMNESEEDYYRNDGVYGTISFCGRSGNIRLKSTYKETCAYLASCGIDDIPEVSDYTAELISQKYTVCITDSKVNEAFLGKDAVMSTSAGSVDDYVDRGYVVVISPFCTISENDSDIGKLLRCAKKEYKNSESRYTIYVNGTPAIVPPQYNSIAEQNYICAVMECLMNNPEEYYDSYDSYDYSYENYIKAFLSVYSEDDINNAVRSKYGIEFADLYDFLAAFK
jgi:hypothetical protein